MNVDVLTLHKPSRCKESVSLHVSFMQDALSLRGDTGALARLKVAAREKDKYLIIKSKQL